MRDRTGAFSEGKTTTAVSSSSGCSSSTLSRFSTAGWDVTTATRCAVVVVVAALGGRYAGEQIRWPAVTGVGCAGMVNETCSPMVMLDGDPSFPRTYVPPKTAHALQNPWATSPAPPNWPRRNALGPYRPMERRYRRALCSAGSAASVASACATAYVTAWASLGESPKSRSRNERRGSVSFPVVNSPPTTYPSSTGPAQTRHRQTSTPSSASASPPAGPTCP